MRCCQPPSWPLLVLVGCVLHMNGWAAAEIQRVRTGQQLAAAISDPSVQTVLVEGPIALEEGDFGPHVTRLTRNLTITSDAAGPHQARRRGPALRPARPSQGCCLLLQLLMALDTRLKVTCMTPQASAHTVSLHPGPARHPFPPRRPCAQVIDFNARDVRNKISIPPGQHKPTC